MSQSSSDTKRNIKLVLEFDGTDYHGWQQQKDLPTIQGEITRAVKEGLQDMDSGVTGCGRTDAGVHARCYCAHFHSASPYPLPKIVCILNAKLSRDIAVLAAEEVSADFSARFSATSKWYRYSILNTIEPHPLHRRRTWHMPRLLDVEMMSQAGQLLVGRHDFTAFSGKSVPDRDPVREISSLDIVKENEVVHLDVKGPSFLYRMVRIIAGTLADVGTGRISVADVSTILASKDREKQRASAPAQGLTLMDVLYE